MNQIISLKHKHKIYQGKDGRWRTYIIVDGKRRMIARKSREDLESVLATIYKEDNRETIETLYPEWIEYKRTDVSEPTIRKYRDAWKRHYVGEVIIYTPIPTIKRIDIEIWSNEQIDKYHLTRKAYNAMIVVMHQLLDYAVDLEIIDHNPARDIRIRRGKLQAERKKPDAEQVFSAAELASIKAACYKDFEADTYPINSLIPLAVIYMTLTGLRIGELTALQYQDIDGDIMTVQRMYRSETGEVLDKTKGVFGARPVPLPTEAVEIITKCRAKQQERRIKTDYIFSMTKGPAPYSAICKAFYKYSRRFGIRKSTHKARKTYISTLIDAGVNINTVRQTVGHVDELTTLHSYIYDRSGDEEKKQAIKDAITDSDKSSPKAP